MDTVSKPSIELPELTAEFRVKTQLATSELSSTVWSEIARHQWKLNSVWANSGVTDAEFNFMINRGAVQAPEDIAGIKKQITAAGRDPGKNFVEAARENRVIGIGDNHGPLGQHMALLSEQLDNLKKAGVTHLAIEIPAQFQDRINRWQPDDREFIRTRLKDGSGIIEVINAAKKADIRVVGIDEFYVDYGQRLASRDRTMAKGVEEILEDPQAKVLMFTGAEHLQRGNRADSFGPSAVELLHQKNISIKTFFPQIASAEDSLMPVARDLIAPVSVDGVDATLMNNLKTSAGTTYGHWDSVVFYPPQYKLDGVKEELKINAHPVKSELIDAVQNNSVIAVGEMTAVESASKLHPHRELMREVLPELKNAGLTDMALDLPPDYQPVLDQFSVSGNLNAVLPGRLDGDDFKKILCAARDSGVKLHAVGATNENLLTMQQLIDGLVRETKQLITNQRGRKVLLWAPEEKLSNFQDVNGALVSVSSELSKQGIAAKTFAEFSQDYTQPSLGLATGLVAQPLVFKPINTARLKEVVNTSNMPMARFDNIILYPGFD